MATATTVISPPPARLGVRRSSLARRLRPWLFRLSIAATFLTIFALARHDALTFPYPWNDEARFFLPSWVFAHTGSLKPTILHAPNGIFWTPHGFYVFYGSMLALFGDSIERARTINQLLVAVAASLLIIAHRKASASALFAVLSALLLLSPPVILSANEVRMEAPIVLLYSLSILLVTLGRPVAALALLLLSLLVHPALSLATLFFVMVLLARRMIDPGPQCSALRKRTSTQDWLLLALMLIAVLLEAVFVARHFDLFRSHMGYQSSRKLHHSLIALLAKPQGFVLLLEIGVAAVLAWLRRPARLSAAETSAQDWLLPQLAAIALGLQVYAVLGAEFQYDIYSLAFAPATFFCIVYRMATERRYPVKTLSLGPEPVSLRQSDSTAGLPSDRFGARRSRLTS